MHLNIGKSNCHCASVGSSVERGYVLQILAELLNVKAETYVI